MLLSWTWLRRSVWYQLYRCVVTHTHTHMWHSRLRLQSCANFVKITKIASRTFGRSYVWQFALPSCCTCGIFSVYVHMHTRTYTNTHTQREREICTRAFAWDTLVVTHESCVRVEVFCFLLLLFKTDPLDAIRMCLVKKQIMMIPCALKSMARPAIDFMLPRLSMCDCQPLNICSQKFTSRDMLSTEGHAQIMLCSATF